MLAYNSLAYLPGVQPTNISEHVQSHMRSAADLMPRQHKTRIVAAFPACASSSEALAHASDESAGTTSKAPGQASSTPLYRGEIAELYGISGSSKTEHTYDAVLSVVLPQHLTVGDEQLALNTTLAFGSPSRAVVIDLDGRYSVQRLVQLINARAQQAFCKLASALGATDIAAKMEQYFCSKRHAEWVESVLKCITVMQCGKAASQKQLSDA